ncbi:MAG: hypothetical protein ACE365_06415 [Gammaproteobacteria bacterium]
MEDQFFVSTSPLSNAVVNQLQEKVNENAQDWGVVSLKLYAPNSRTFSFEAELDGSGAYELMKVAFQKLIGKEMPTAHVEVFSPDRFSERFRYEDNIEYSYVFTIPGIEAQEEVKSSEGPSGDTRQTVCSFR